MTNALQTAMELNGNPTLKALATAIGLPAPRLYSVAKQPQEGMVYDAKAFNWDALERFVERRLDAEKGIGTLEEVAAKAAEAEIALRESDGRHKGGKATIDTIEVDGKTIPVRKFSNFEIGAELPVVLKGDTAVYKIVYQTVSHTVLVPIKNKEGEVASQAVKVISNTMLNSKGFGPVQLEAEIAKRLV